MPVPSTMMEFRLTMVGMPKGRVTSRAGLHHGDGADGDDLADVLLAREDIGQRVRDEALAAVAAVVGGDDQLVAELAEPVLPEHQVAVAEADDRDGAVARLLVLAELREDGRDAQAAAHQDHGALELADVAGQAERADEVQDGIAFAERHHFGGGFADRLDDDGDGAASRVEIGYGERNALAVLVDAGHDEVPGPRRARHIRRVHVPEEGRWTELFPTSDEKHHTPLQLS